MQYDLFNIQFNLNATAEWSQVESALDKFITKLENSVQEQQSDLELLNGIQGSQLWWAKVQINQIPRFTEQIGLRFVILDLYQLGFCEKTVRKNHDFGAVDFFTEEAIMHNN